MSLGKRVEQLRKEKGWTQAKLSGLTAGAITQQNLDRLEKRGGKTSEAAPALADALGVSLRWLLTGHGRQTDTDWPFGRRVLRERWDACSDEDRGYIQAAINKALDECEAARSDAEQQAATSFRSPMALLLTGDPGPEVTGSVATESPTAAPGQSRGKRAANARAVRR